MKASYKWLRELVPQLVASPREVAARLTAAGLEVEGIDEYGVASEACVVARVVSLRPHPTKSGLRLVTVDRGAAQQELVCGAPNVPEPGGLVVLAPLGAYLPAKDLTIGKRAIGGVESEGMLCSEEELGLGDGHEGILILPPGTAEPGTKLATAVPTSRDTIFEIGLTPNRPDGLGHVGLARELCALYNYEFSWPKSEPPARTSSRKTSELASIAVEDAERCPHYGAAGVEDVAIRPSPLAVRFRLQALGVRAISNVVDVTNLVMLEFGHPMHAFDLDRVRSKPGEPLPSIVVRRAKPGEPLTTLDGIARTLSEDDLLICDGQGPVALAGVIGGQDSEIQEATRRVLFEVAWFDPRGIRRTSRRQGVHTESSHRFERGVDPGDVARVLDRATALTVALSGGVVTRGHVHVQNARNVETPEPPPRRLIQLRQSRIGQLLGIDIPANEVRSILERLGCVVESGAAGVFDVTVPSHRPDLNREVDLIEEAVRVFGIDKVPAELPSVRASRDHGGREELARLARASAASVGLSEAITFGFTSERTLEVLAAPKVAVRLQNPLGEHHAVMRTTILPGLLDAVRHARRHGVSDVRLFTLGPVFLSRELPSTTSAKGVDDELPVERLRLGFVLAGERPAWLEKPAALDVWDAKGYASAVVERICGEPVQVVPAPRDAAPAHLHPRGAAFLVVGHERIGTLGPLHPDAASALELDGEVFVCEIDLERFTGGPKAPYYAPIPRFPAATRDVALVVKDGTPAGDVEKAVRTAAGALAEDVQLFDRFVGGQVAAGTSSLAFHVVYRAADRTLTDAEVDAAHANVVKEVGERFGATLR